MRSDRFFIWLSFDRIYLQLLHSSALRFLNLVLPLQKSYQRIKDCIVNSQEIPHSGRVFLQFLQEFCQFSPRRMMDQVPSSSLIQFNQRIEFSLELLIILNKHERRNKTIGQLDCERQHRYARCSFDFSKKQQQYSNAQRT